MARFEAAGKELSLRFLLCGPKRAGKSEVMARVRERVGSRSVEKGHDLAVAPMAIPGAGGATLAVDLVEIDPSDDANKATEALLAAADGVCFVADPRRERLRDNLMAYAWLLERLRGAGRGELPGVLLLNRRARGDLVEAEELESVIGGGRFPSFTTDATCGDEVARTLLELLRRGATRAHAQLQLDEHGIAVPPLMVALDETFMRPAVVVAAVEPAPATPMPSTPTGAPIRSPLIAYAKRLLVEQGAHARERRRMRDQSQILDDEARRPLNYLRSLFAHLERNATRLPTALEEAIAGGGEVLSLLESIVERRSRLSAAAARGRDEAVRGVCDLGRAARHAVAAAAAELQPRRMRVDGRGVGACEGDVELMRTLFWSLFVALAKSRRARPFATTVVRVRASTDERTLKLRIGRFGPLSRGHGIEELVLARRLARRVGWRLQFVPRRAGEMDLRLEPRAVPAPPSRPRLPAFA